MGCVIEQIHPKFTQHTGQGILDHKSQKQTVGKAEIGRISGSGQEAVPCVRHRAEFRYGIYFPADLPVQQTTVVSNGQRACVKHHRHGSLFQLPGFGSPAVIDLSDSLYFQKVIAAAYGADLIIIGQALITSYKVLQPFCGSRLQASPKDGVIQPPLLNLGLIIPP